MRATCKRCSELVIKTQEQKLSPGFIIVKFGKIEVLIELFHEGVPYHAETSSLICYANQWGNLFMIELISKHPVCIY